MNLEELEQRVKRGLVADIKGHTTNLLLEEVRRLTDEVSKWRARCESLANFNPDWDMLEATQESLREHQALLLRYRRALQRIERDGGADNYSRREAHDALGEHAKEPAVWESIASTEQEEP